MSLLWYMGFKLVLYRFIPMARLACQWLCLWPGMPSSGPIFNQLISGMSIASQWQSYSLFMAQLGPCYSLCTRKPIHLLYIGYACVWLDQGLWCPLVWSVSVWLCDEYGLYMQLMHYDRSFQLIISQVVINPFYGQQRIYSSGGVHFLWTAMNIFI